MTWYLIATNLHSDFYGVSVLSQMHIGTSLYVWCSRSLLTIHKMFRMIMEVHLWLDKYIAKSIKDSERKRLGVGDLLCVSTGLEHTTFRQSGQKLLSNELVKFLICVSGERKDLGYVMLGNAISMWVCPRWFGTYQEEQADTFPRQPWKSWHLDDILYGEPHSHTCSGRPDWFYQIRGGERVIPMRLGFYVSQLGPMCPGFYASPKGLGIE